MCTCAVVCLLQLLCVLPARAEVLLPSPHVYYQAHLFAVIIVTIIIVIMTDIFRAIIF